MDEEKKKVFELLVDEFAGENYGADGCRECHEMCHDIVPQSIGDAYDRDLEDFYNKVKEMFAPKEEQDDYFRWLNNLNQSNILNTHGMKELVKLTNQKLLEAKIKIIDIEARIQYLGKK